MRQLSTNFVAEAAKKQNRPLELYRVYLDEQTLYLAAHDRTVYFYDENDQLVPYYPINVKRTPVRTDIESKVDEVTLTLDNINQEFSAYAAHTPIVGRRCQIIKIFNVPANYGFARASSAYLDDGTAVVSGQPRFEAEGIVVEEGTTNLFVSAPGIHVRPNIQSGQDDIGKYFIKLDNTTSLSGVYVPNIGVLPGQAYTVSIEIMSDIPFGFSWDMNVTASNYTGNDAARQSGSFTPNYYDSPGQWKRVFLTCTVKPDATNPKASDTLLVTDSAAFGHKIYYRNWQLEQKPYATSYHLSIRSKETLTIPTAGMTPTGGTIEGIFICNEMARRVSTNLYPTIAHVPGAVAGGLRLMGEPTGLNWVLECRNDAGTWSGLQIPNTSTPDGPLGYRIAWEGVKARLEFWSVVGNKFITLLASKEGTVNLPSGFNETAFIGAASTGSHFNTIHKSIRTSKTPRFDGLGGPLVHDAYTLHLVTFDGGYYPRPEDCAIVFDGKMDAPSFTETAMEVSVKSQLDFLGVEIPRRTYQPKCNNQFGDNECTVNLGTVTGTIVAISEDGLTLTLSGRSEEADWFEDGIITVGTEYEEVLSSDGNQITIGYPFNGVQAGDNYTMRRGCNKTFDTCDKKFNNASNFGGFRSISLERFITV